MLTISDSWRVPFQPIKQQMKQSDLIFHIASQSDWQVGLSSGIYKSPSLAEEGFIHACDDEVQMRRVAARLFAGKSDLLLLDIDCCNLAADSPVIREQADTGEIYPHVYGTISLDAVVGVRKLIPNDQDPRKFELVDTDQP